MIGASGTEEPLPEPGTGGLRENRAKVRLNLDLPPKLLSCGGKNSHTPVWQDDTEAAEAFEDDTYLHFVIL